MIVTGLQEDRDQCLQRHAAKQKEWEFRLEEEQQKTKEIAKKMQEVTVKMGT